MDDVDKGEVKSENYSFQIAASADEVTPKLVQGDLDIAAVPANLSSILYNNTKGKVQVLAVNTHWCSLHCREWGNGTVRSGFEREDDLCKRKGIHSGICAQLYLKRKWYGSCLRCNNRVEKRAL